MEERVILTVAFIGALIGIVILFFISQNLDYDEKTIEQINAEKIDGFVKLEGRVVSSRESGNVTFITLMKESYVDVTIFDKVLLYEGENLEIIAKKDDKGIVAHRIRMVD